VHETDERKTNHKVAHARAVIGQNIEESQKVQHKRRKQKTVHFHYYSLLNEFTEPKNFDGILISFFVQLSSNYLNDDALLCRIYFLLLLHFVVSLASLNFCGLATVHVKGVCVCIIQ
jgi:hypothetical protein